MKQKKAAPARSASVNWLLLVRQLLCAPTSLRWGISNNNGLRTFALIATHRLKVRTLAWGHCPPPWALRFLLPPAVYTDAGDTPVYSITADAENRDPDEWIDANEAALIPGGFSAEKLTTGYAEQGSKIAAVSAPIGAVQTIIDTTDTFADVAAIYPPLHGFAQVFCTGIPQPFIIWKVDSCGSNLCIVNGGRITGSLRYYPDSSDVAERPGAIINEVAPLIRSLAATAEAIRLVCLPAALHPALKEHLNFSNINVCDVPSVKVLVPEAFIGAFGNALPLQKPCAQLLPPDMQSRAGTRQKHFVAALKVCQFIGVFLMASLFAGAGYIAVSSLTIQHDREAMAVIDRQYAELTAAQAARDTLLAKVIRKNAFVAGESGITRLVSELQEAFPEGVRAEELTIDERSEHTWSLTIRMYAKSSSLLQQSVSMLQKIPGISDVRLVYSESSAEAKDAGSMLFKIEALWR